MLIHDESLHHYLAWMRDGKTFAFAGYSDAEWRCIFGGEWEGTKTGLGQTISTSHGLLLADVLKRRQGDPRFLFAVPKCLWNHERRGDCGERWFKSGYPGFAEGQVDWWLGNNNIKIEGWERDKVLDDPASTADLFPLIDQLRSMRTVMVGPKELWPAMTNYLDLDGFVQIDSPNLHMTEKGIDTAVTSVLRIKKKPGAVYLISAGVSAAVIIDQLYEEFPDCWFLDCGSIWDAFVGIGGQREWRKKLYDNPDELYSWRIDCLHGKKGRTM